MTTVNLKRTLSAAARGHIIIPVVRAAMVDPQFRSFNVKVRGWREGVREFDGWFHPSTHGSWTARQLALYLKHGKQVPTEKPGQEFVMAVTQGSFWHEFFQRVLLREGLLARNPGAKASDPIEKLVEVQLQDPYHNRRGHADGRMTTSEGELFEFKTMNSWKQKKIENEDDLREQNPFGYFDQAQDYLDIAGAQRMRYLTMSLESPFPMTEFVVHADPEYQAAKRRRYRLAIEHHARGTMPPPCGGCGVRSKMAKACPVRTFCPVGRIG